MSRLLHDAFDSQLVQPNAIASAEAFGTPVVAGPITAVAIPSAEAFGSPTLTNLNTLSPPGIASAEAFGTPRLNLTIYPNAVASAEAFGTPAVSALVRPNGVASAEAFGSPQLNLTIYPNAVASAQAFGTPRVNLTVFPDAIASAEAFGTPHVSALVRPNGIASTEAFGTPKVNLQVRPNAIATAEAFGSPRINQQVRPNSVTTAEAFGSPQVNLTIFADTIFSEEAFGSPSLSQSVSLTGIASAEAFGTPDVSNVLRVFGIASAEAFGAPVIAGPVTLVGVPSGETFGLPRLRNPGHLQLLSGSSGALEGGTDVQLSGAVLDMSMCADDFADGVVNPMLWTTAVAGTGSVAEVGGRVQLDTGTTAGSSAVLRSLGTVTGVDIEVMLAPDLVSLPLGGSVACSLALRVAAGTEFRLSLEVARTTRVVHVTQLLGGQLVLDEVVTVGGSGPVTLRITRYQGSVVGQLNGQTLARPVFVSDAARFEFRAENDGTNMSRLLAKVTNFRRYPAVVIGGTAATAFLLLTDDVVVVDAPAGTLPGDVDVTVYGCTFSETLVNGFTYELGDRKVVGRTAGRSLYVLNDPRLK